MSARLPAIPNQAHSIVEATPDGWLLESPSGRLLPALGASLVAFGTVLLWGVGLFLVWFLLAVGVPAFWVAVLVASGLCGASIGAVGLLTRALRPRPIRIDSRGVHGLPCDFPLRDVRGVRISGKVGESIRIRLDGHRTDTLVRASSHQLLSRDGWDLESLVWFAEQLASFWEVPLSNSLDTLGWDHWLSNSRLRRRMLFDKRRIESETRFSSWHTVPPAGLDVTFTHHGLRADSLGIENGELQFATGRIALNEIEAVAVHFERDRTLGGLVGGLLIQHSAGSGGVIRIAERRVLAPDQAAALAALATLIGEHVANARPVDCGSEDEVPSVLGRLRSRVSTS